MFWGLRLEPGKRYSTTVDKSFHVSMAALDCSTQKSDSEILSVMVEEAEADIPYILCNLHKQKAMQSELDLNFMTGDRVTFYCRGNGVVYLTGYIVPDDDEFSDPIGDDEELEEECEEEESNEMETSKDSPSKKVKGKMNGIPGTEKRKSDDVSPGGQKKKKLDQEEGDSEESEEDEDDEEEDVEGLDEMGEESDGTEDEESEESDENEHESEEELKVPVKVKTPQQQKKDNKKPQTPAKGHKSPNGLPANEQSGKKEKKNDSSNPGAQLKKSEETSPPRKIENVLIKDIKIGNGPVCKPGKMATVYYVGKLKSNNKIFDSTQQGPGFKFRLGRGDVIKGWDVGLNGMKVGGKRTIICPPQMAYGQKGFPPSIPSNSTLVFEIELKGVN